LYFAAPVFEQDEEKTARARLLLVVIRVLFSVGLLTLIFPLVIFPVSIGIELYYGLIVSLLCVFVTALVLAKRGYVRAASFLVVGGSWLFFSALSIKAGGIRSNFYPGYITVIVLAGLLLGRRSSLVAIAASIGAGLCMVIAEEKGLMIRPPAQSQAPLSLWVATSCFVIVAASLQYISNGLIRSSLAQARRELDERKQADEKLIEERNLLRTLIDNLSENIYIKDREGRFLVNNKQSIHVLKASSQTELIGKSDFDFFPRDIAERWRALEQGIMESGQALVDDEEEQPWRGDERRWVEGSIIPLRDSRGQVVGILGMNRDITPRKRMEAALRASETRYRIISELMTDYAFAYDVLPDGRFVTSWITDASFTRLTGYTWDEIGATYKLYHPDDAQAAQAHVAETLQGKTTQGEYRIITKSGEIRWIHIRRRAEWDEQKTKVVRFYGVAQDITERKRLEAELHSYAHQLERRVEDRTAELRHAKEQIEAILNNISDAIVLAQPNGDIQTTNPAFKQMFGDRVSKSIEHFLWVISDEEQIGSVADALVSVIEKGENKRTEARIIDENGEELDLDLAFIPINGVNEEDAAILLSAHDITYLKELERFKAQFLTNAVHDLSSPITALGTRVYLLKRTPERLPEHVKILEAQIQHLKELVTDLRSLSELDHGLSTLKLERLNLNELVTQIYEQYAPVATDKRQQLSLLLDAALPAAPLDRLKCERIIVNLIANAINYTPEGKLIRVVTQFEKESLIFAVEDQGIGIAKEDLPHIFERFYRTDRAKTTHQSGTGIGLAIVKEMVTAHSGTVTVESEINRGSTFTVRLPHLN
jgi:PAS domain S-box-containing protein